MQAIRATVRDGRIELDDPVDLPVDGTALIVFGRDAIGGSDERADDSLEPLVFTPDEQRAWDEEREARKQREPAHADTRSDRLRDMWR